MSSFPSDSPPLLSSLLLSLSSHTHLCIDLSDVHILFRSPLCVSLLCSFLSVCVGVPLGCVRLGSSIQGTELVTGGLGQWKEMEEKELESVREAVRKEMEKEERGEQGIMQGVGRNGEGKSVRKVDRGKMEEDGVSPLVRSAKKSWKNSSGFNLAPPFTDSKILNGALPTFSRMRSLKSLPDESEIDNEFHFQKLENAFESFSFSKSPSFDDEHFFPEPKNEAQLNLTACSGIGNNAFSKNAMDGPLLSKVCVLENLSATSQSFQNFLAESLRVGTIFVNGKSHKLPTSQLIILLRDEKNEGLLPRSFVDIFGFEMRWNNHVVFTIIQFLLNRTRSYSLFDVPFLFYLSCMQNVARLRVEAQRVYIRHSVAQYLRDIVVAVRQHPRVAIGPNLTASNCLKLAACAHAVLCGSSFLRPSDIDAVALEVISHRILLCQSNASAMSRQIVSNILIFFISTPK